MPMSPQERRALMLEGPVGRALTRLALPIILANILQAGYQLTDAFWVGRLGAAAVAAVTISFPVTFLVIAAGAGLAMAGSVMVAQHAGAGRQDQVNHVAAQTMLMVALTSLAAGTVGYLLSPLLVRLLGVAPEVHDGALRFMRVSFIGIGFVFLYGLFQGLMRSVGHTRAPLIILGGTVALNFLLDPLFIFGFGPVPAQGVMGAALATVVTQGLATAAGLATCLRGRHGIHLSWRHFRPDLDHLRRAFRLGLPGSVEMSARSIGPLVLSFLVAKLGTVAIAAYGVGSNVLQMVVIPAMGLSMAVSTVAGQNRGAGNLARAHEAVMRASVYSLAGLTAAGLVAYAAAPAIATLFVPGDPVVIAEGARFIRIMCLSWGGIGLQLCALSAFRAAGRMAYAMGIALVGLLVIQLPLAYGLSATVHPATTGFWLSFPIANVLVGLGAFLWYRHSESRTPAAPLTA
ncbi:MAG: MATE family efflux transporter [Azospirillaceae bacterium]|nr:MATE family efflux transporter [Azospirillaceae bacterium]